MPQREEQLRLALGREPAAELREDHGEEHQHRELGGEGLGRSDADLGSRAGQEAQARRAHQRRLGDVADREAMPVPERLGVLERRVRVGGLAGLGNRDDQRLRVGNRLSVTIFARDLDARRDARDALQPVARHHAGVKARAAGENQHGLGLPQDALGLRAEELRRQRLRPGHHLQGVRHRHRLLEDLLLHVMAVQPQLDRIGGELRHVDRAAHCLAVKIGHARALERDFGAIAVLEIDHAPRDLDERRGVRGGEVLAFAQAEEQGRAVARDHEPRRIGFVDHRDGVDADQLGDACAHRVEKRAPLLQMGVHEVSDDLGVGVRDEHIALRAQLRAQLVVIFDDAVVHDRYPVRDVRMGVLLRRHAVRRPAGVRDADVSGEALRAGELFQLGDAARRAHAPQPRVRAARRLAVEHRDPGGIVAAIFEPLQPLDEDRNDVALGDRADYPAHVLNSLPFF